MIAVTTNSLICGYDNPKKTRRVFQGKKIISEAYRYEFSSIAKLFIFLADAIKQKSTIQISKVKDDEVRL